MMLLSARTVGTNVGVTAELPAAEQAVNSMLSSVSAMRVFGFIFYLREFPYFNPTDFKGKRLCQSESSACPNG
jgi:hypothetical protein